MIKEILNDKVKPYNKHENKTAQLKQLFNKISGSYDSFNDLISWGMAHHWRKKAISYLIEYSPKHILDVATGTADMLIATCELLHPNSIIGIDISDEMMKIGKQKVNKLQIATNVNFEVQDASALPYPDKTYDAITISFGLRNLEKLSTSLQEINRVLKPNGNFLIVEVNKPRKGIGFVFYKLYIRMALLLSSKLLDKTDFHYLTSSMDVFPNGNELIELLTNYNFELIKHKRFIFDVCSAYLLRKSN